jgi:hypothetical protein
MSMLLTLMGVGVMPFSEHAYVGGRRMWMVRRWDGRG